MYSFFYSLIVSQLQRCYEIMIDYELVPELLELEDAIDWEMNDEDIV